MEKKLLLFLSALLSVINLSSQTIATARAAAVGSTVTVYGVVTNGAELGNARYMQDPTGGIIPFGSGLSPVNVGDSIVVTGPTSLYNNLLEILPINSFSVLATGRPLPAPNLIAASAFNESVEATLIRINNSTFSASGNFVGNTNYTLTSGVQTFVVRIDASNTFIVGTSIPAGPVDIIGVAAQFCSSPTTGCTVGYQLHPRTLADIILLPTGIKNNKQNSSLIVYPNPARDMIKIKSELNQDIKLIVITDLQGRIIYSVKENVDSINVSEFQNGIYSIAIITAEGIYHSKFSVQ